MQQSNIRSYSRFVGRDGGKTWVNESHDGDRDDDRLFRGEKLVNYVRKQIIGCDEQFSSPYGARKITYCDYVASGRSIAFIESYISEEVLPVYANSHTTTSLTGLQTTLFRQEARGIVSRVVNCSKDDVVMFMGSGTTAAVNGLVRILELGNRVRCALADDSPLPVVVLGPYEHHSNLLPWRETGAEIALVRESSNGGPDLNHLQSLLSQYQGRSLIIGSFSAASNVSGILTDTVAVTKILHEFGALAFFDYATAAPYTKIDMNPNHEEELKKDAIFFSPHKFIGGVGTPGILVVKKKLLMNAVPNNPGGGTVFFVTEERHRYLGNFEEREEGGTPDIVGSIRCGLVMQLKEAIGEDFVQSRQRSISRRVRDAWSCQQNLIVLGNVVAERLPIFSFKIGHRGLFLHYNFVSSLLNDLFGIQCRGGCVCAGPYGQNLLGIDLQLACQIEQQLLNRYEILRPGFVRLNFSYTMDDDAVQFVIDAVLFVSQHGWKFLPEYGYHIDTGEWSHRRRLNHFKERRWLGHISYESGSFEYRTQRERVPDDVQMSYSVDYMSYARSILSENLVRRYARYGSGIVEDAMMSVEAQQLRWYLLPSEAMREIRSAADGSAIESPFNCRMSNSLSTPESIECTNAGETSLATSNSVKRAEIPGRVICRNCFHHHSNDETQDSTEVHACLTCDCVDYTPYSPRSKGTIKRITKKLMRLVQQACKEFDMIQKGDRLLVAVSGGKDSLTLFHILRYMQEKWNYSFELGVCTVDPGAAEYDPSPLKAYFASLGVPYFYQKQDILAAAKECMNPKRPSICSFCARMKRGILNTTARNEGYNVLVMGQHLDDLAESFCMSAFHNGILRTMKANYHTNEGDLRVIRPLVFARESLTREYASACDLPVIFENCPACFEAPQERQRIKVMLASQEHLHPHLYSCILNAITPLMKKENDHYLALIAKDSQPGGEFDTHYPIIGDDDSEIYAPCSGESCTIQNTVRVDDVLNMRGRIR